MRTEMRNPQTPDPEILLALAQEDARTNNVSLASARAATVVDLWDHHVEHLLATGEWVRCGHQHRTYQVLGIEAGHGTDAGLFWARLAAV